MNPYHNLVSEYARFAKEGRTYPLGNFLPTPKPELNASAPKVLIFSPHPDDECIIGALPLRLLRAAKMNVINVAVTQGSNKARQTERYHELENACAYIGYGLIQTRPGGLEKITPKTRAEDKETWNQAVQRIRHMVSTEQPRIIFFPHEHDWNSTHIGTHWLVMDALRGLEPSFRCYLVETEYWGAMSSPNLMVESSVQDVTELVAGTSFHVGEVRRNPFHLLLPAWMQDNVRRGSELVGGQGEAAPDFVFTTLYRLRKWEQGEVVNVLAGGKQLACGSDPQSLFA
ncbi:MAG: PIG-L family deacetylase [Verrucomicrobiota bacterium]